MVSQEEREQRQKEQLDANQKAFEQQEADLAATADRYSEAETSYQLKAHGISLDSPDIESRFKSLSPKAQNILLKEQEAQEQAIQQIQLKNEQRLAEPLPEPTYDGIPENVPTAKAGVKKEPISKFSKKTEDLLSSLEESYVGNKARSSLGSPLDLETLGGQNQSLRIGRGDKFNVPKLEIQKDIIELDYRVPEELTTVEITPTSETRTTTKTIERFVVQDRIQKAELLGNISLAKSAGAKTIEITNPISGSVKSVPIERARFEILKVGLETKQPVSYSYQGAPEIIGVTTVRVPATTERKSEVRKERAELGKFISQAKAQGVDEVILSSGGTGTVAKVKTLNRELAIFKRGLPNNAEVTIAVPTGPTHNLSGDITEQKSGIFAIDKTREIIGGITAPIQNIATQFYYTPERYAESLSGKIKYSKSDVLLPTLEAFYGPFAGTAKAAGVYDLLGIKTTQTTSPVQKKIESQTQPLPISNLFQLKSPVTGKGTTYDIAAGIGEGALFLAPVFGGKIGFGRGRTGKAPKAESELFQEAKTIRKTPTYRATNLYRDFYEVKQGKATTKPGKYNIFDFDTAEPQFVVKTVELGRGLGSFKGKGLGGTTDTPPSLGPSDVTGVLPKTKGGGTFEKKVFVEPKEPGVPTGGNLQIILEKPIPTKPIQDLIQIQKPISKKKKMKEELTYEQFSPQIKPISISTKAEAITLQYLEELSTKRKRRQSQQDSIEFIQFPKARGKSRTILDIVPDVSIKERQRFALDVMTPQKEKQKLGFGITTKQSFKQTPIIKLKIDTGLITGTPYIQRRRTTQILPPYTTTTTTQITTTKKIPPYTPPRFAFPIPPIFFPGGRGGGGGPRKPRSKSFDIYSVNPDIIGSIAQAGIEPLSSSKSPSIFGKVEKKLKKAGKRKGKKKSLLEDPLGFG
jgi:hypothetical protein